MTPPAPMRLHVVDDDAPVRRSMAAVLEGWGFDVATYESGDAYLEAKDVGAAACIMMDVRMPGRDGVDTVAELRRRRVSTPVIMVTGHGDVALAVKALQAGAQDFVEKPFDDEDLVARIRRHASAPPAPLTGVAAARQALAPLTERERDVMRLVVQGLPNKLVAHRLRLSVKTVEAHRARVMRKTGSDSLSHLVRLAIAAGEWTDEASRDSLSTSPHA